MKPSIPNTDLEIREQQQQCRRGVYSTSADPSPDGTQEPLAAIRHEHHPCDRLLILPLG